MRNGQPKDRKVQTFMKKEALFVVFLLLGFCWSFGTPLEVAADPVVSITAASQRTDGSQLVDLYYDLSGGATTMTVSVTISSDNGQTWAVQPNPSYISGDVGVGITNGTGKHIVWDAGNDKPNVLWPQTGVKIRATETYAGEEITIMLPGDVPLVLVRIPAGSFQMGSPDTERSRDSDEGPVHTVNITYDYYMGKYEVTQTQWIAVMGSWPGKAPNSTYGVGDNYPAYYISWNDIAGSGGFIEKLNQHITLTGQGSATFRLPSEAEWEYACRAGTQTRYFFGDSLSVDDLRTDGPAGSLSGNRSDYMWFGGNNTPYGNKEVGAKLPNQFGLYDMSGNVYDWCEDFWHSDYTNAPTDGSPWTTPTSSYRIIRGGDWGDYAYYCRSASRYFIDPGNRHFSIGFRLLRTQN